MDYSSQNAAYLREKQKFFSQIPSQEKTESKIKSAEGLAKKIGYTFLLENQISLEAEFTAVYKASASQKQSDENKEISLLHCYYFATMLEAFYKAYSHQGKIAYYASIRQKIKNQLNHKKEKKVEDAGLIDSIYQSFIEGFRNLANAPTHLSSLRGYIAYTNICRIYWIFCRLTMIEVLNVARDFKLIEQLDLALGIHTDVDKIISAFKAPTFITNYLSVGLLLGRFMIDGGLLLKHTFFPSEEEKGNEQEPTTAWDRFKYEAYKRQGNFINDIGWVFINLITNFPEILNISGATAGYITSVYLIADIALIVYMNYCAKQEFLLKKNQYLQEIKNYNNPELYKDMSLEQKEKHINMLKKQLIELEKNWCAKEATSYFTAAAGILLMMGFTASMFVSPALMVLASYFVCTLGVAMYLSVGTYAKYKEKTLDLEQEKNVIALKEYKVAKNDFIFTLTKNTLMPPTLILSFALYWPAAIALTLVYLSCEIYHAHDQHSEKMAINELIAGEEEVNHFLYNG